MTMTSSRLLNEDVIMLVRNLKLWCRITVRELIYVNKWICRQWFGTKVWGSDKHHNIFCKKAVFNSNDLFLFYLINFDPLFWPLAWSTKTFSYCQCSLLFGLLLSKKKLSRQNVAKWVTNLLAKVERCCTKLLLSRLELLCSVTTNGMRQHYQDRGDETLKFRV